MEFKRVERKEHIEANKSKGDFEEILKKKCKAHKDEIALIDEAASTRWQMKSV